MPGDLQIKEPERFLIDNRAMLQENGEFIPGEAREETSFGNILFSIGEARWIIDSGYVEDPVDGYPFSAEKTKTGTLGKV
jgi:hypothetical protein